MLIAIGDIHGEIHKLRRLLAKLEGISGRMIFLGDYVDRGPDSRAVIEEMIRMRRERPDNVFLRGNHEQAMLDARESVGKRNHEILANWMGWGGAETVRSYPGQGYWTTRVPHEHWAFLESTLLEHRQGPYLFVHAGIVPPGRYWEPLADWASEPRLWIREPFLSHEGDLGAVVVFGHTVQLSMRPFVRPNRIGIDTGATFGGPLTAALLPSDPRDGIEFVTS